uniref:Uncharacterized protein n=1 Tax=Zea mays TaxID=4577 RepID=A0A804MNI6_MAIZE
MAPQISRLDHLPTPQNFDYKTALLPWSSKKKGTKERDLDPHTSRLSSSRPKDNENIKQENQRKQSKSIALEAKRAPRRRRPATSHVRRTRTHRCIYGAPEPAVGRHGGRAAPGLRPRQAPQVRLLLPLVVVVGGGGGGGGGGLRAASGRRDAELDHAAAAGGAVRRHVAPQRVQLRAVVPVARKRRSGFALRRSDDAQGRGLDEEAARESQDGRRRR